MAVNYSDLSPGTPITWTNTGGTYAMNMKNMGATIREGVKSATLIDSTKGFPEVLVVTVETELQSAPTDGLELVNYIGWSSSATAGTDNPGGLTGADAAVADADQLAQLNFIGSVVMASSLHAGGIPQRQTFLVRPVQPYMIPVTQNSTGQTTTNVDGETKWTVTPYYRRTPIA